MTASVIQETAALWFVTCLLRVFSLNSHWFGWCNVSVMGMREWFSFHDCDADQVKLYISLCCHVNRDLCSVGLPSVHMLDLGG